MPEETLPQVAFLGFAERAISVREGETNLVKWNVLGLKNILLTNFFPFWLNGWNLALALRITAPPGVLVLKFKADSGEEIGGVNLGLAAATPQVPLTQPASPFLWYLPQAWLVAFLPLPAEPNICIQKPGRYVAAVQTEDANEEIIGEFYCALVDPPPLTPEREAAIRSNPRATKAARMVLGCTLCPSKFRVYAALERMASLEAEGFTWYRDIAEHFICECGKTQLDLSTVKQNFFAVLGQPIGVSGQVDYKPFYERSALENLRVEFVNLLNTDPPEESLQQFIEQNPILLHQFPAEKLFFKPPISTRFKADFAVVTSQKELVLIEIERPSTCLLKQNGEQHSDLTHAVEQINQWLGVLDDHRLSALEEMRISREMVSKIRGVVIAGRDAGNDANHLRRLRGSYQDRVALLTYDDLAVSLAALAQKIGDL